MDRAPQVFVVCYDIREPTRLRRVYSLMRGYGDHLQHSVFRCTLNGTLLARLEGRLRDIIHEKEDQVLFVPLGRVEGRTARGLYTIGQPMLHPERVAKIL